MWGRLGSSPSQTFTYYLDRVKFTQEFDSILCEDMRTKVLQYVRFSIVLSRSILIVGPWRSRPLRPQYISIVKGHFPHLVEGHRGHWLCLYHNKVLHATPTTLLLILRHGGSSDLKLMRSHWNTYCWMCFHCQIAVEGQWGNHTDWPPCTPVTGSFFYAVTSVLTAKATASQWSGEYSRKIGQRTFQQAYVRLYGLTYNILSQNI